MLPWDLGCLLDRPVGAVRSDSEAGPGDGGDGGMIVLNVLHRYVAPFLMGARVGRVEGV